MATEVINYHDPNYHGTDQLWRHPYGILYTDSIRDFIEEYEAYWTLDVVGSYFPKVRELPFLLVFFDVVNCHGIFRIREDTNEPDLVTQEIEYTDLKVSIKLYLYDGILMFPSDY